MPNKTANWGVPGSGARYRTQDSDPTGGGNFVVAERLDSNGDPVDVLLEWDETAGEWKYGGPVNLDGSDVTNVGALDANSVSTGNLLIDDAALQARQSGMFVPIGDSLSPADAVDPTNTTTPLQDATDVVDSTTPGGGFVLCPAGTYDEAETYNPARGVTVLGAGHLEATTIKWPEGVDMVNFASGDAAGGFKDIHLQGAGPGTGVRQDGIVYTSTWQEAVFDRVKVSNIYGKALVSKAGSFPFEMDFRNRFIATQVDAGDLSAIFDIGTDAGPDWTADTLKFSPTANTTGQDSDLINTEARQLTVKNVQTSGSAGRVIQVVGNGIADIRAIQYEPGSSNGTTDRLVNMAEGTITVGAVNTGGSADYDYVYRFGDAIEANFGPLATGNPNQNVVTIGTVPSGPSQYLGEKADVDNNAGTNLVEPNTLYALDGPVS